MPSKLKGTNFISQCINYFGKVRSTNIFQKFNTNKTYTLIVIGNFIYQITALNLFLRIRNLSCAMFFLFLSPNCNRKMLFAFCPSLDYRPPLDCSHKQRFSSNKNPHKSQTCEKPRGLTENTSLLLICN